MTERQFHTDYLSLSGLLYRIAFYLLESEADAEDAVQELYLRLWKNRNQLDEVRLPKAYSIRMLKNLCLDRIRAAQHLTFTETLPEEPSVRQQDDALDQKQRLDKVLEAVKALPERQREILLLRTVEGLSYEEISRRIGMSPLTLRVLLSRARSTIKSKV